MRRCSALLVLLVAAGVLAAAPDVSTGPGDGPMGSGHHERVWFPSLDGTMLHADVLLPAPPDQAPAGGWPVIVSVGPYFGRGSQNLVWSPTARGPVERFADLLVDGDVFARGYAWMQVDSRGFGASGGCNDLGGIGEQLDVAAAVEWAGEAPWSNGRVGMWGKSYDAWTQVMALAMNPPHLEAVVIQAPLISGDRGFWMNGVHRAAGWYATPSLYLAFDLMPPSLVDSGPDDVRYPLEGTLTDPGCPVENHVGATASGDTDLPYWVERDLVARARDTDVPVLWSHGFHDPATAPHNLLPLYGELDGWHRGWFGHWAHDRGNEVAKVGRDGFLAEALDVFDHFLKGEPFEVSVNAAMQTRVQDQHGDWRLHDTWPPTDAPVDLGVLEGGYADAHAAGGASGTWTFTPPAPHPTHVSGAPVVRLEIDVPVGQATVVASLHQVDADGSTARLATGAALIARSGTLTFELFPVDWALPAGARLGLQLTSNGPEFEPRSTLQPVTVAGGAVALPFVSRHRAIELEAAPSSTLPPRGQVDPALFDTRTNVDFVWPSGPR